MLSLPCKVGLAPLAGYTNSPFREVSYEHGACFAYSEMISAESVLFTFRSVAKMLPSLDEPFTGIQIYGSDEKQVLKASMKLQGYGKFLDINAGCPVKKVVRKGAGGALLKDILKLERVVRALKKNLGIPITVKTRLGWDKDESKTIYYRLVNAGVDMVAIHARTVKQAFKGKADWKALSRIGEKPVPLFLSGDIFSPKDAIRALEMSGASGILVARGAIGNPWIFHQIRALIDGNVYSKPSLEERMKVMMSHLGKNVEFLGEKRGVVEFRKIVPGYTKSLPNAREFRAAFMKIDDYESAIKLILNFFGHFQRSDSF